ncbi:hypothetical protein ThrDRAFT_00174 [Frankia casuarinae]|uniref:Mycothiol-dependent maleylpyruvate isomerase metal-binding domain-containing protein n=1 Tax=Frankia casuarinae (strain DSM 45818 / CECT 9043 / HFP020203 / CcI3) TaxID=106370 RepID=Q2J4D8_FRACC|nr:MULTISPECIES: maleylpyruvate isomerase family mycothiol-dependent enzyme [Frankia]ABD13854.1 conserved hypothetical protein [Frankia casuarinae]EYT94248.1 hypothetical protein ThrDRAFT_00174 [Frankia casuarinae]KDA42557.1 hypothetical protein BMG523Draft_02534 [Frankia sp. BMG5.23]KEZ36190.1 hypothetical protein CEDDRAFT_02369 [Frankia sp. CeD]TFE26516.1 maleylpyruvate isomerase family mycothiol-dependent enzyme [Frankia sp. B2]
MTTPTSSRPSDALVPGAGADADPGAGVSIAQESSIDTSPPSGPSYLPSVVPHDRLAGCAAAHRRLLEVAGRLDDVVVRRPLGLPGWTVGHLLTHLARNADGHTGMVEAARAGGIRAQYPGGARQREDGIAAGRDLPAAHVRDDLVAAVTRLERAWDGVQVDVWRTGLGHTATYGLTTLADLVFLRWRETEIHLVDLDLADLGGPGWADLSPAYVQAEWEWTLRGLPARVPPEITVVLAPGDRPSTAVGRGQRRVVVDAPTRPTLRWLAGRDPGRPDWPTLAPWE